MNAMAEIAIAGLIFLASSLLLATADFLRVSPTVFQAAIVGLAALLLIILNRLRHPAFAQWMGKNGRWAMLFIASTLVQLIVIGIGGARSPFIILLHLFVLGISLIFSFGAAMIFLALSIGVLAFHTQLDQGLVQFAASDPSTSILYGLSFLIIIPVAQFIAHHYHLKDALAAVLSNQLNLEEAILSDVPELIFVCDQQTMILAVNETAERLLQRPRGDLIGKPLFDILLMRDETGRTITSQRFEPAHGVLPQAQEFVASLVLTGSANLPARLYIKAKPVMDLAGSSFQWSFILADPHHAAGILTSRVHDVTVESRLKYEAMIQDLQQRLFLANQPELSARMLLTTRVEQDTYMVNQLQNQPNLSQASSIDLARLCRQICTSESDYAHIFSSTIEFQLPDFGETDIAPLVTATFKVAPEELTGPFFTIQTDVSHVSLAIQKLLQLAVLLCSNTSDHHVLVNLLRQDREALVVDVVATCDPEIMAHQPDLFMPYYGALLPYSDLGFGSGLEGYVAQQIASRMGIALATKFITTPSQVTFRLTLPKVS
jgi:PAS domain-containing protein